jgi:hypothetical protein
VPFASLMRFVLEWLHKEVTDNGRPIPLAGRHQYRDRYLAGVSAFATTPGQPRHADDHRAGDYSGGVHVVSCFIVIFQSDIRRALAQVGTAPLFGAAERIAKRCEDIRRGSASDGGSCAQLQLATGD